MQTKKCSSCDEEKPIGEFTLRRNYHNGERVRHSQCKECVYESGRRRIRAVKLKLVNLKGGKCISCGYCKNLSAMDFHHRDPSEKEFDWRQLMTMLKQWDRVLEELEKCDLLCNRCHQEIHHPGYDMEMLESMSECPICGGETYGRKYCSPECRHEGNRKYPRPPKEDLQDLLDRGVSQNKIREMYGVSHGTLTNWLAKYGLREYACMRIANVID